MSPAMRFHFPRSVMVAPGRCRATPGGQCATHLSGEKSHKVGVSRAAVGK